MLHFLIVSVKLNNFLIYNFFVTNYDFYEKNAYFNNGIHIIVCV
jgi:hypothetical protein